MGRRLILIMAMVLLLVLVGAAMTGCGGDGDAGKGTDTGMDTETQPPVVPSPDGDVDEAPDMVSPDESADMVSPDESADMAAPDESPVAGYNIVSTIVDEGFTSTEYAGAGTVAEALDFFYTWAEDEGWVLLQEGFSDIPEEPGMDAQDGLAGGRLYEKGDETMSITAMKEGDEVHVFIDIASAQAL